MPMILTGIFFDLAGQAVGGDDSTLAASMLALAAIIHRLTSSSCLRDL
jgi:hypothetical protein